MITVVLHVLLGQQHDLSQTASLPVLLSSAYVVLLALLTNSSAYGAAQVVLDETICTCLCSRHSDWCLPVAAAQQQWL